ncbi:acyltransferase family protein [Flavitalea flava]
MEGNASYIRSLDGVRAIAIILVMTFHAGILDFGWIGVQLFFVLSGFLITGILWKEKTKEGSLGFKFKKFWVRRSLRIFPLYYAYLLIFGVSYLLLHFPPYFMKFFPFAVTYTANFPLLLLHSIGNPLFNHLWSLSIEEQFYLLFPVIILLSPKPLIKFLLWAILFISPFLRFLVGEYYKSKGLPSLTIADGVNFNTLCQLDAFCMGGIIPVLSLDKRVKKPWTLFGAMVILALGAGLAGYLLSPSPLPYLLDLGYYHYFTSQYQHIWQYTCLNLVFASLILALVSAYSTHKFPVTRKILENKWMVSIGKVSYGMYLFHWLIWIYLFYDFFRPQTLPYKALLFIPYVFLVYLVSRVSYRFYEAPFIRLKDRFFPPAAKN